MSDAPSIRARLGSVSTWEWIAWLLPGAAVLLSYLPVGDLAYLIRSGELMRQSGDVLRRDVFTFTMAGQPWLNQQWGAELVLSTLYGLIGWKGLFLVRAGIVSAGVGVTFRATLRASRDEVVAGGLTLGAFLVAVTLPGTFALRPQLLAVPLFLAARSIIAERDRRSLRLAWLPLIGVVWANLHGSFLLLPVLLSIAFVQDLVARKPTRIWTGILAAVTLLTPLATPWGIDTYRYLRDISTSPVITHVIDEWKPLTHQWPAGVLFLGWNVIALAICGRQRRGWPTFEQGATFLVFTALAVWSGRNLLWWMIATPPVIGAYLEGWSPSERTGPARVPALSVVLIVILGIALVRTAVTSPSEGLLSEAPLAATGVVQGLPAGTRVFDGRWGSWFEFSAPNASMFVDSRAELFPDAVWADYFGISGAEPGWQEALRRWNIDVVVGAQDHDGPLIQALSREAGWDLVYEDGDAAIFIRSAESPEDRLDN